MFGEGLGRVLMGVMVACASFDPTMDLQEPVNTNERCRDKCTVFDIGTATQGFFFIVSTVSGIHASWKLGLRGGSWFVFSFDTDLAPHSIVILVLSSAPSTLVATIDRSLD